MFCLTQTPTARQGGPVQYSAEPLQTLLQQTRDTAANPTPVAAENLEDD